MDGAVDVSPVPGPTGPGGVRPAPVLGFDIGGTKLAAGVVDPAGRALSFVVCPTRNERGPDAVLVDLFGIGRRALDEAAVDEGDLGAVGIGCGGPLDPERGVLVAPPHLLGWRDVPMRDLAERQFGRPAFLENDATAAASAEHRYGAGVGARNMVYLTISTGVGGGVVIEDRLYRGATGNGGELGHLTVDWRGRPCRSCGRQGCLEAYVSGTSIAERAAEAIAVGGRTGQARSALASADQLTSEDVAAAARAGDPLAMAVWEETIDALACGLTSIVNLFEPERVVLGGGVTRAGDQLLAPVRDRVVRGAMAPAGRAVSIVTAGLGDQVGVVGAASIAYERLTALSAGLPALGLHSA
jgi:glucokinase